MFFCFSVLLCYILSIKRLNPLGKLLFLMVGIVLDIFSLFPASSIKKGEVEGLLLPVS